MFYATKIFSILQWQQESQTILHFWGLHSSGTCRLCSIPQTPLILIQSVIFHKLLVNGLIGHIVWLHTNWNWFLLNYNPECSCVTQSSQNESLWREWNKNYYIHVVLFKLCWEMQFSGSRIWQNTSSAQCSLQSPKGIPKLSLMSGLIFFHLCMNN